MPYVTIPNTANPWVCIVNNKRYAYTPGAYINVPTEVAAVIKAEKHYPPAPAETATPFPIPMPPISIVREKEVVNIGEENPEFTMDPEDILTRMKNGEIVLALIHYKETETIGGEDEEEEDVEIEYVMPGWCLYSNDADVYIKLANGEEFSWQ